MQEHFSLKAHNSFGFDAEARYFVEIQSIDELQELVRSEFFKRHKRLVLSGGNNILFANAAFDGIVIYMNNKGITFQNETVIRAQAGEDWPEFVRFVVGKGLYGLENLAHIPGKVGAAPVQNIGAYGMELKDSFLQCEAIHLETGKIRRFTKEECQFGYRSSIFKNESKGKYIITSVDFQLKKQADLRLDYGNIKSYLTENGIENPTLQQVHDAICAIRDNKLPDVKKVGNAGSFFKNPVIEMTHFERLAKDYPEMPHYTEANNMVKIPAGWLIEKAGWKGWRDAHVGVWDKQALVLVHYGEGEAKEILGLMQKIQASVKEQFGIEITPEVNIVS